MSHRRLQQTWPLNWPKYLPLEKPVHHVGPVPNASSINWPQSQFAPLYRSSGSASFQPYAYLKDDTPLSCQQPVFSDFVPRALGPLSQNTYHDGPGGDTSAVPRSYGGYMRRNPSLRQVQQSMARNRASQRAAYQRAQRRIAAYRGKAQLNPAVRIGPIPTNVPVMPGVPRQNAVHVPPSRASTAGLTALHGSLGGIALDNPEDESVFDKAKGWWDDQSTGVQVGLAAVAGFAIYKFFVM